MTATAPPRTCSSRSWIRAARSWPTSRARRPGTARAIVGGGESLIVAELGNGRAERVPELLPDILYLALTPYVGQEARCTHSPRRRPAPRFHVLGRPERTGRLDALRYHK